MPLISNLLFTPLFVSMSPLVFRIIISWVFITVSFTVYAQPTFSQDKAPAFGQLTGFKGSQLCEVAENTNGYLANHSDDQKAVHAGKVIGEQFSLARVVSTLQFLCDTYRSDVRAKRQSRLHDSDFLKANFEFVRWLPDKTKANSIAASSKNEVKKRLLTNIPKQQLFVTKYYTKLLDGSEAPTATYNQALYQLPNDEQDLTLEQAALKRDLLTRFKFTRQQIISGALKQGDKLLATPLVWLTEEALHDVLLQGTGVLKVNGQTRYFNVHRNNGIAYDYHLGKREQARYWYFAEVPSILGYGKELQDKVAIHPQVSLAGNVKQLGLGKLMLLSYQVNQEMHARLAILADEGGAFDDNLFQLDLLVGSYRGWQDYYAANKHLPDYADVWILLKKQ